VTGLAGMLPEVSGSPAPSAPAGPAA